MLRSIAGIPINRSGPDCRVCAPAGRHDADKTKTLPKHYLDFTTDRVARAILAGFQSFMRMSGFMAAVMRYHHKAGGDVPGKHRDGDDISRHDHGFGSPESRAWMSQESLTRSRAGVSSGAGPSLAVHVDHVFETLLQFGRIDGDAGLSPIRIARGIWRARRMLLRFRIREGFELLGRIEGRLVDLPGAPTDLVRQEIRLLRALGFALQDNSLAALATLSATVGPDTAHTDSAAAICRLAHWQLGNWQGVRAVAAGGRSPAADGQAAEADILSRIIDAAMQIRQLHLSAARRTAADALALAERFSRPEPALAVLAAAVEAQALYEQGQLGEAEALLLPGLDRVSASGTLEGVWLAYFVLSRIAAERKQHDFALLLLRQAEMLGLKRGWPRLVAACLAERVSLLLRSGRDRDAELCAARLDRFAADFEAHAGEPATAIRRHRDMARARMALASGQPAAALAELRRLYGGAVHGRDLYLAMQLGLRVAGALEGLGHTREADTLVLKALRLGSVLGLFQIFLDEDLAAGKIILRLHDGAMQPASGTRDILAYAGSLVSHRNSAPAPARSGPVSRGRDCLSERESDILKLVSQGLSNKRIAQSLKIAPETVKSHVKRIFSKLAVKTRAEAVARADALGLL